MADYGMKVAVVGGNVYQPLNSTYIKNYTLVSTEEVMKQSASGVLNSSTSVNHGFSFSPFFTAFTIVYHEDVWKAFALDYNGNNMQWDATSDTTNIILTKTGTHTKCFYNIFNNKLV